MKRTMLFAAMLLLSMCTFVLSSCDNDDDKANVNVEKPTIDLKEVGEGNSKTAVAGSDLHLEGDILAPGLIKSINVEIHSEEGGADVVNKTWDESSEEGKQYIGVKNTHFHEHLDIPKDATPGSYHLHFTVTDQQGNQTTFESELTIEAPDPDAAEFDNVKIGKDNNMAGQVGSTVPVSVSIKTKQPIKEIEVEFHGDGGEFPTAYTDKYAGKTDVQFSEDVPVPATAPAGEYHVHITVTEQNGHTTTHTVEGVELRK